MKKHFKMLFISSLFIGGLFACNENNSSMSSSSNYSSSSSSFVNSSTSLSESSSQEVSSNEESISSEVVSSSEESSSQEVSSESSSSIEVSSESSSSEVLVDDCYMVGYGSYLTGSGDWQESTGIKLETMNDNPNALEKYTTTVDLLAGDVFMFHLLSTPDRWYGTGDLLDVTHPDYQGAFFEKEGDNNIKTKVSGNYTIYVSIWANYTADIYIAVNSFTPPAERDNCYMVGYGSFLNGTGDWQDNTGIKLSDMYDDPSALEKYSTNTNLKVGDVFTFHLLSEPERWYGISNLNSGCNVLETNFKANGDNFEVTADGNYTFYITIFENYSSTIWIDIN